MKFNVFSSRNVGSFSLFTAVPIAGAQRRAGQLSLDMRTCNFLWGAYCTALFMCKARPGCVVGLSTASALPCMGCDVCLDKCVIPCCLNRWSHIHHPNLEPYRHRNIATLLVYICSLSLGLLSKGVSYGLDHSNNNIDVCPRLRTFLIRKYDGNGEGRKSHKLW